MFFFLVSPKPAEPVVVWRGVALISGAVRCTLGMSRRRQQEVQNVFLLRRLDGLNFVLTGTPLLELKLVRFFDSCPSDGVIFGYVCEGGFERFVVSTRESFLAARQCGKLKPTLLSRAGVSPTR